MDDQARRAAEDEEHQEKFEDDERREDAVGALAREVERLSIQVRGLEVQLRVEKHEHTETRARLARTERERDDAREWAETKDQSHTMAINRELDLRDRIAEAIALLTAACRADPCRTPNKADGRLAKAGPFMAPEGQPGPYDLNPTAAQLSRLEHR